MRQNRASSEISFSSSQYGQEEEYWLNRFSGELPRAAFPYDLRHEAAPYRESETLEFTFTGAPYAALTKITRNSDTRVHMVLTAAAAVLLGKYTGLDDIIIGIPIYKQDTDAEFTNTVLALRLSPGPRLTFKELLLQVRQRIIEANENANYPIETLLYQLKIPVSHDPFPLFDVAVLLENIHLTGYLQPVRPRCSTIFSFIRQPEILEGRLEYNPLRFQRSSIQRIVTHFTRLTANLLTGIELPLGSVQLLTDQEKQELLVDMNSPAIPYETGKTIHGLFERQEEQTPHQVAVIDPRAGNDLKSFTGADMNQVTYRQLNRGANRLARLLKQKGVGPGTIAGVMMERSVEMVLGMLAILKAGGGYFPIDSDLPGKRILSMTTDIGLSLLVVKNRHMASRYWREFQVSTYPTPPPLVTPKRPAIKEFSRLPIPDRLPVGECRDEADAAVPEIDRKFRESFPRQEPDPDALRILLLDLSLNFTREVPGHEPVEAPLGLMYVLSYINREYGRRIHGKIAYKRIDFDNYRQLKSLVKEFKPGVIGLRTLTHFKESLHETTRMLRQWGVDVPVVVGGPYATSEYQSTLKDKHIDMAVLGEGEITFSHLIGKMLENQGKMPGEDILRQIPGLAFVPRAARRRLPELLVLDEMAPGTHQGEDASKNLPPGSHSRDPVYVIFTSGTTGISKGVLVNHQGLVNLVSIRKQVFGENRQTRMSQVANAAFDAMAAEIWPCLLNGGALYIADEETRLDPVKMKQWLITHGITLSFQPTMMVEQLLKQDWPRRGVALKALKAAGDQLRPVPPRQFPFRLYNLYGPTEDTVWTTWADITPHPDQPEAGNYPPIGKPVGNHRVCIIDRDHRLRPFGVPGELAIAGIGLARGYLNRPGITAEKFILPAVDTDLHRFAKTPRPCLSPFPLLPHSTKSPVYLTGDLARWLAGPTGVNIQFLGRIDQQVKIRGNRVELGEIQHRLGQIDYIDEALVIDKTDENGDKYLVAYLVFAPRDSASPPPVQAEPGKAFHWSGIRDYLAGYLPDYMLPSFFVSLEKVPLTPNGKLDRSALPEPEITADQEYIGPRNETEKKLLEIWSRLLGLEKHVISIKSNFFELGGHSLKATIMNNRIQEEFQIKLPLVEIFKSSTIEKLARIIMRSRPAAGGIDDRLIVLKRVSPGETHLSPLFFIHDGSGEVEGYVELCSHLDIPLDCWGIKADPLENHTPRQLTVEQIAQEYIEKIKKVQPSGPYSAAGWSFGGIVAFEVVRRLEAMGETVKLLAIFDSPPPREIVEKDPIRFELEPEKTYLQNLIPHQRFKKKIKGVTQFDQIWPTVLEYLVDQHVPIEKVRELIPPSLVPIIPNFQHLEIPQIIEYLNIYRTFIHARGNYVPTGKVKTRVHYFAASQSKKINKKAWRKYADKPVLFYEVKGSHITIFKKPGVIEFSRVLASVLTANLQRNGHF